MVVVIVIFNSINGSNCDGLVFKIYVNNYVMYMVGYIIILLDDYMSFKCV